MLGDAGRPMSTAALEPRVELSRGRLEMMLKVLDTDGAVRRVKGGWEATGQAWEYDGARYTGLAKARRAEQQAMLDYIATDGCRMEFLRRQLDDPGATPCGRCDNCTGQYADPTIGEDVRVQAQATLDRPGVPLAPRKQWPSGMDALDVAAQGQDQARGGGRGRAARSGGSPTSGGARACARCCTATTSCPTPWSTRPSRSSRAGTGRSGRPGSCGCPSRGRPALVESFAQRIASIGRLPLLGALADAAPPRYFDPEDDSEPEPPNSAQRLAEVYGRLSVPAGLDLGAGPVLLIDDVADSGWTLTVAAMLLRRAGAPAVLPLCWPPRADAGHGRSRFTPFSQDPFSSVGEPWAEHRRCPSSTSLRPPADERTRA